MYNAEELFYASRIFGLEGKDIYVKLKGPIEAEFILGVVNRVDPIGTNESFEVEGTQNSVKFKFWKNAKVLLPSEVTTSVPNQDNQQLALIITFEDDDSEIRFYVQTLFNE
ncbi:hypothetical protein PP175_21625 [Aneurinibacillus sp. Ricciae_BoGa-3]|uniref:hypothetical protein n=1 Tax=Aneurinibacillus sp. Ricciae_BoGa-3 TaxID=3022697 RepID=UPI00233FCFEC|nr:hypothetical protein [Aneurinibacillus sp. Ricciae_BoGa-3]WCK53891.1 hypothetical protein PP175_21625 [Aneurinibacillus sp. Ricciae_BoGa-3]